jgi:hypothetical protein
MIQGGERDGAGEGKSTENKAAGRIEDGFRIVRIDESR